MGEPILAAIMKVPEIKTSRRRRKSRYIEIIVNYLNSAKGSFFKMLWPVQITVQLLSVYSNSLCNNFTTSSIVALASSTYTTSRDDTIEICSQNNLSRMLPLMQIYITFNFFLPYYYWWYSLAHLAHCLAWLWLSVSWKVVWLCISGLVDWMLTLLYFQMKLFSNQWAHDGVAYHQTEQENFKIECSDVFRHRP